MQRLQNTMLTLLKANDGPVVQEDSVLAVQVRSFYPVFNGEPEEPVAPCTVQRRAIGGLFDFNAYEAFSSAPKEPQKILEHIRQCALVGRGGSEFPVWLKWDGVRQQESDEKWVICNCAEGEPGTGKDHSILLNNPDAVVVGMILCARTVGAEKGVIYLRSGYSDAAERLNMALSRAREYKILGDTGLEIMIFEGAGAYVCGEESGLLEAIEGRRGEPRLKPPYPSVSGLFGKPTVINNCESFANAALAFSEGAVLSNRLFTLSGCVANPGVYEMDADVTVRQLLTAAGGEAEFAQVGGGATGTIVTPADFDCSLKTCKTEKGFSAGTGAVIFHKNKEEIILAVLESLRFLARESCGKCVPCRLGVARCVELLENLMHGTGNKQTLAELKYLAAYISPNAQCGLGQAAPTILRTALQTMPDAFEKLVKEESGWEM